MNLFLQIKLIWYRFDCNANRVHASSLLVAPFSISPNSIFISFTVSFTSHLLPDKIFFALDCRPGSIRTELCRTENWYFQKWMTSKWTKTSLSVPETILEHRFLGIWLFKNLRLKTWVCQTKGIGNWKNKLFAQKRILSKIYSSRWWNKQRKLTNISCDKM